MTATTTTIRTRRPAPEVTHEPVPSELQRVFEIGRRIGKTVTTTEMFRAMVDPAGAEALAAAEAKRERKAAKRERDAQRQRPTRRSWSSESDLRHYGID